MPQHLSKVEFDAQQILSQNKHITQKSDKGNSIVVVERNKYIKKMDNFLQKQPPKGVLRKGFLKICSKFTGEHPCQCAISIKLLCTLHGCSPVNLLLVFKISFLKNTSGGLLPFLSNQSKFQKVALKDVCSILSSIEFIKSLLLTLSPKKGDI